MIKVGTQNNTGVEACLANLKRIQYEYEKGAMAALIKWGRETMDDSKNNFCPVDKGLMKGTGNITTEIEGSTHNVILFYNTPYAPIVHENPRPYHPIGEYGFLIKPFNSHAPKLVTDLKDAIEKVVK